MGIDIYMKLSGQTQRRVGSSGAFSVISGHTGYLREAYHGEPYATRYLVREAFEPPYAVAIPAKILRKRLARTITLAMKRQREVYKAKTSKKDPIVKSYIDFVELAEREEKETGKPVIIGASY